MRASLHVFFFVIAIVAVALLAACGGGERKRIILIGGAASEGPARHSYPDGVRLLESFLRATSEARGAEIVTFADGWPKDPTAFDGASTLVLYFDGLEKHPLLDAGQRRQFEALMKRGVGLVALHQASTVPADDTGIDLTRWLGGARFGTFDRSTETVEVRVADPSHPLSRGVRDFSYRDEFYPTVRFAETGVAPILTGTLHVQYRDGASVVEDLPEKRTLAWAYERAQGGRSFGFTGAHYLAALDHPMLRKTLLNAILWTANIKVPREGAAMTSPGAASPDAATRIVGQAMSQAPFMNDTQAGVDAPTFHGDAQRSGWHSRQTVLTPGNVGGSSFGLLWESPQLDPVDGQPPRLYASPLYVDRVKVTTGQHRGVTFSMVFAASNNGYAYAINAAKAGDVAAGRILWRTRVGEPCRLQPAPLDAV
ncbi:MAG: ThuA domain-containing protein, partial [Pseudoxanthomonas sp.]